MRAAALILFAGFAAFLVRNLFHESTHELGGTLTLTFHVILTVVLGTLSGALFTKSCHCVRSLRIFELRIFGLPAAFFVWIQFCQICHCNPQDVAKIAYSFPSTAAIPWMILIHIYGLFIPNTWKRATAVILVLTIAPLIGALLASTYQPALADVLYSGLGLVTMGLYLAIPAATAIYGCHRTGLLQREAFDAQRVGVYSLREKLGTGGMGDVYLAEHRLLKRPCAIKPEIAEDVNAIARFESEVQATAMLTHPNTIEIYDYGYTNDGTSSTRWNTCRG